MAIRVIPIKYEKAVKLLQSQEDHFRDFKAKEIKPAKITKSISAFAKADGGDLYIGIDQDKDKKNLIWRGFYKVEDANSLVQTFDDFFPLWQYFLY
ncbi:MULTISPECIES: helix-turn-helix domain-containing protein [Cyanophyceae]|uniref:AlbA family DNA-binding domain-containing protein n=1 Tax=Cyanophyceae TaxID=3028117 RepID=UPI00232F3B7A|nr:MULTISPECIES: RNA-binding domain-containing protein [Cyanophyceae]MDB9354830.1 putative DNA binding domain-containing protein [Nodularia spumigena CS-587/03]MDB9338836.1 putative DNA binding domain-containing protein [Nodularia spumigena CS-589/07]MDB9402313.1 putative DNA binding domain-containing protein [Microcystis aeruginosa CS-567/02-A1]MDB9499439.1 putative DNA binding domain-containing protein [Nodularia spumigena CS-336/02]MDB9533370.1 putative DNA binding domain-containing protein